MPEQPNDLDICIEKLNNRAWWQQRPLPDPAQRMGKLLDDLKLNRKQARDQIWILLEKSTWLRNRFRAKLKKGDADSEFPGFVQELFDRLVCLRHRGQHVFDSGHDFKDAKDLAAYLASDLALRDPVHRIWREEKRAKLHTSLEESAEKEVRPEELWSLVRDADQQVRTVLGVEEEPDVPAGPVAPGLWRSAPQCVKQHLDTTLCTFLEERVRRSKSPQRTQTRRALWELTSRPLRNAEVDSPWPFWRFCVRLLGREALSLISRNEPEISEDLHTIGISGSDVWKHRIRESLEKYLTACGIDFADERVKAAVTKIAFAVTREELPSGLGQVKEALGIRTDWEEALFEAVQAHNPQGAGLIAALCPPRHDEFYPGLTVALLNQYPERSIFTALEEEECLLPLLERWEGSHPNRPWLAVVPKPERFTDLEEAREWLNKRGWRVLLLTENEDLTLHWPQPFAVVLGALASPEEIAESEREVYESFLNQVRFHDLLECVCLFTAWHRKPLVSQVVRILGGRYTEEQVRPTVEQSAGLLAFDPLNPDKIMRSDLGWAAARVLRRPQQELVGRYSQVLGALDPGKPEDRNAVRNLYTSWYFIPPPKLRLARCVFLAARQKEDGRPKLLDFANREDPQATGARRRWAEILSFIGEHQEAHDLLLNTERGQEEPALEALNARIFKTRFRDSGRTLYFNLAERICQELIAAQRSSPAAADPLREQLAELYHWSGNTQKAIEVLEQASTGPTWFRRGLRADLLAETGRTAEAEQEAATLPARRKHPVLLEQLRGADWRSYIDSLLDPSRRVAPAALVQAAGRALDRGLFEDAKRLVSRGLEEAPDNVFIRTTEARLFHERGAFQEALHRLDTIFEELANKREAEVIWVTRLESALELFRATGQASVLPDHRPHPLQGKPPKQDRALNYHLYLMAAEAKLYWYGAENSRYSQNLASLANALIATIDHPFLRSLAARILADDRVRDFPRARQHLSVVLEKVTGQARIRALNLLASIWEREAAHKTDEEAHKCRQQAIEALQESRKIDPENTFTLAALERLRGRENSNAAC
jgi:hypothetical protein